MDIIAKIKKYIRSRSVNGNGVAVVAPVATAAASPFHLSLLSFWPHEKHVSFFDEDRIVEQNNVSWGEDRKRKTLSSFLFFFFFHEFERCRHNFFSPPLPPVISPFFLHPQE